MPCRSEQRRRGFTLIELLVVIAIIATLASVVAPALFGNVGEARKTAARAQIEVFGLALDAYRLDLQRYPRTDEGLGVLREAPLDPDAASRWRGPYLRQEVPLDPWGRPWIYVSPGERQREGYDLYTLGRDGAEGGDHEDEDLTSWRGPLRR
ncbi:MAG: type II secretion system major pseudopilin GspG [Gemmatimonadetes bacterium]|nr:type II secretion system major pseudopilin GspG [Gemmatimonadota bacterium]